MSWGIIWGATGFLGQPWGHWVSSGGSRQPPRKPASLVPTVGWGALLQVPGNDRSDWGLRTMGGGGWLQQGLPGALGEGTLTEDTPLPLGAKLAPASFSAENLQLPGCLSDHQDLQLP